MTTVDHRLPSQLPHDELEWHGPRCVALPHDVGETDLVLVWIGRSTSHLLVEDDEGWQDVAGTYDRLDETGERVVIEFDADVPSRPLDEHGTTGILFNVIDGERIHLDDGDDDDGAT